MTTKASTEQVNASTEVSMSTKRETSSSKKKQAKVNTLQWVSLGIMVVTTLVIIAFLFDSFFRNAQ